MLCQAELSALLTSGSTVVEFEEDGIVCRLEWRMRLLPVKYLSYSNEMDYNLQSVLEIVSASGKQKSMK